MENIQTGSTKGMAIETSIIKVSKVSEFKFPETDKCVKHVYGATEYYVIAPVTEDIDVGDIIEYQKYAPNFGWFIRIINSSRTTN